MAGSLPPLPASLKAVQHYIKTATEHDKRDPLIAYYCRLYAFQKGMELDKSSPDSRKFLLSLMDQLESEKTTLKDLHPDEIGNDVCAQAYIENYALKLFLYADNEDRASRFGKNVVKSFYTAGMLFDVLSQFGELSEDIQNNQKYAKWKAAYIHNCLKSGETPHPGPLEEEGAEAGGATAGPSTSSTEPPPIGFPGTSSAQQPHFPPAQQPYQPPAQQPYQPPAQQPYQPPAQQPYQPPAQQPYQPPAQQPAGAAAPYVPPTDGAAQLSPQDYQRAMKLCKYASSALQYEDSKTAIDNLAKALNLLTSGKE